jgi:hypothetical protein
MFRLTKNVLVLWPFYTPVGGLFSNLNEGLTMPFEATYGFVLTMGMMLVIVLSARALAKRRDRRERPT